MSMNQDKGRQRPDVPNAEWHQRFASIVSEAFRLAGNHTDVEVKDAGGPSSTFMTLLRRVERGEAEFRNVRTDTLRRIDAAANWEMGSARNLWLWGDEPVARDASSPTSGLDEVMNRIVDIEERLDALEGDVVSIHVLRAALAGGQVALDPDTFNPDEELAADSGPRPVGGTADSAGRQRGAGRTAGDR